MMAQPEIKKFPLSVVGGSKFARYTQLTAESTVNMFVTGKDVEIPGLVPYFGYKRILELEPGEARGIFVSTRLGAMVVVVGKKVFTISRFLTAREVGELDTSRGNVSITDNINSQITIEDNNKIYVYDYANSSFSSPSVPFVPVFLDYQDTYTIATDNEGNWHLSDSGNSSVWPPLDLRQLQTKADTLSAAVVLNRQLWIIGTKASELWYDRPSQSTTGALFPYVRDNSLSIDYGAVSTSSIATGFKKLVWLGKNEKSQNVIVYTEGGPPVELSHSGLDYLLNSLDYPESSYGFIFQQDGHIFYQLTFNKDNLTVVYDFTSGEWHRATDEKLDYHIARDIVFFNGKTYFISFNDSFIYELDSDITTYDGEEIPRYRILPPIKFDDNDPFILNALNLQMEQGENDTPTKVGLSLAKNSGNCFGNVVIQEANAVGHRQGNMTWHGMGRAIDVSVKLEFWSKGRFVVTGGSMELYK